MKILKNNNNNHRFWSNLLLVGTAMMFVYLFIFGYVFWLIEEILVTLLPMEPYLIILSIAVFSIATVRIAKNMKSKSYDAHDLVFDASGVTLYDGRRLIGHHDWSEYKTRCIISYRGKPESFYFSHEPLYLGYVMNVGYNYLLKAFAFSPSEESISFPYQPELYAAFQKNCPDVELLRVDTNGEVYVITEDDREILVVRIFHPEKVLYPQEEDARNMLEILDAINAVRAAEAAKPKASREKPTLAPEEMPVFAVYPKKTENPEEAAVDRWDREHAERQAEEKRLQEVREWSEELMNKNWREKRVFEIIENPVAQKSVMAAAAPEADEPAPTAVPQSEAAVEAEKTTADEADFAEDPAAEFPEESADEELPNLPGSTIRSVEEILASASRTVESVRGLGSRFREEDASAEEEAVWSEEAFTEADDAWEEEAFSDEDME